MQRPIVILLLLWPLLAGAAGVCRPVSSDIECAERPHAATEMPAAMRDGMQNGMRDGVYAAQADTTIAVDRIEVTAIKQGIDLRREPVAATIVGARTIERDRIDAVKRLAHYVPNLHMPDYGSRMTSSIYVRGLGARIDQPVVGLNIDNVPVLNKNNFDTELADAVRIEVLRGPQATLYGRNTMGGVVNVYTRSPLEYEGVRLAAEFGSGATWRLRASAYYRIAPDLGVAVTGYYGRSNGLFENLHTGERCDVERSGGGRWRLQWRGGNGLRIDNTLSFSVLDEGGYPYAYAGREPLMHDGQIVIRPGEIRYNDPCAYRRTTVSDGLTIRRDWAVCTLSSITSYSYSDDAMTLDQDFTPRSYFTLRQALREHALTEDLVVRAKEGKRYEWLFGAFGFYRHGTMHAPVVFKRAGIEELIIANANQYLGPVWNEVYATDVERLPLRSDFRNPVGGGALYHESNLRFGGWRITLGLRFDAERTALEYRSRVAMDYTVSRDGGAPRPAHVAIDDRNRIAHTYCEWLPKAAVQYDFGGGRSLYLSAAKGYKAGGFNTQMFSDILSEKLKWKMAGSQYDEPDLMSYRPEYSWNYELGGRFACADGAVRGDAALFCIDCRDQQLTVFPEGQTTGRMMTNAGRTRSCGAEATLHLEPQRAVAVDIAYGFTDARFVRYRTAGKNADGDPVVIDYAGKQIPYAPRHTLSLGAAWSIATGVAWLGDLVLQAGMRGAGRIYWDEENTRSQSFYTLVDASLRLEHTRYSLALWGRNLADTRYEVFRFESMGREFAQRGRPRTFGITLNIHI